MVELCTVVSGGYFKNVFLKTFDFLSVKGKDPSEVWSHRMNIMVAFSHLLIVLNCSVNFIIYCWKVNIRDKLNNTKLVNHPNLGCQISEAADSENDDDTAIS